MNQAHYGMNGEYIVNQTSINHESSPKTKALRFSTSTWGMDILLSFHNEDYCIGRHAQCGCVEDSELSFALFMTRGPSKDIRGMYDHTLGSDIKTHIKWAVSQVVADCSSWVCTG